MSDEFLPRPKHTHISIVILRTFRLLSEEVLYCKTKLTLVGFFVGTGVVGEKVGSLVGTTVECLLGLAVGLDVVGSREGAAVGQLKADG